MKPETLERLKIEIKTIPDKSLSQFFIVVLNEIQRRKTNIKKPQGQAKESRWKDCSPIRGY